ncbi:synaptic vesicle glycoprotein 2A-like isoform X2 [Choristoneura fumiferana]|uniref:synaptic vesicle glycoprotein 2A-like isoform X2 n=1 Tax=Choristoneura fumiferana TaxID=7141 RepID=UPI003D15B034
MQETRLRGHSNGIYTLLAAIAEVFSVGIIVTSSQCDLELGVFEKGIISSVPILGVIASAHFWGYLADTRGRLYTLNVTILGTVAGAFLASFANHWAFLTFAKFMSSIFACGSNSVIYTLLGESTQQTRRSRFLLFATTGVMFSQGIICAVAYPALKLNFAYYIPFLGFYYRPWRLLNQIIALLSLINFILIKCYIFESPKFYISKGEHDMGLGMLRRIYSVNSSKNVEDYTVKHVILNEDENKSKSSNFFQSVWNQTVPLFHKTHIKNTLLIFGISIPTYCITPPFSVWLPYIFNSYVSSTDPDISFCQIFQTNLTNNNTPATTGTACNDSIADFTFIGITGFSTFITLVSVFCVITIKYTGKKWTYVGIHLLSAALAVIIDYASLGLGVTAFVGMLCNTVCMGITTSYAVELFPTYMRAMAVGLSMMVGRAVSFIFFNIIGVQLLTNCSNFLLYLAIFIFSGAVLGIFLPSDPKSTSDLKQPDNNSEQQT